MDIVISVSVEKLIKKKFVPADWCNKFHMQNLLHWFESKYFREKYSDIISLLHFTLNKFKHSYLYLKLSTAKQTVLPLPFQFECILFHFRPITLAGTSRIMMNSSGKTGHPYLVPEFGKKISIEYEVNSRKIHSWESSEGEERQEGMQGGDCLKFIHFTLCGPEAESFQSQVIKQDLKLKLIA